MKKEQFSCLSYLIRPHKSITFWNRFQTLLFDLCKSASLPDIPLAAIHKIFTSRHARSPTMHGGISCSPVPCVLRLSGMLFRGPPKKSKATPEQLPRHLCRSSDLSVTQLVYRSVFPFCSSFPAGTLPPARHHHTFLSFSLFPASFLLTNPARGAIIAKRKRGEDAPCSIWVWRSW